MDDILTASGLWKSYRGFHALSGLNMRVPRGAIYGLVGRNGAGKTTLIRLICGLQAPTSGRYTLFGLDHSGKEIAAVRRRMGAVVESPSIYLDLSAANNIKQQYRVMGIPSDAGTGELLELVGLSNTGRKRVRHFSLGMRQRLGIAMALAGAPDFLVLDEPVNGLDPQGIIETRELILKLNRERQITVLISSHILDELSRLATHYGFIDGGRMVKEVSAQELEAACRKCLRVEVTDTRVLARVLDGMGIAYKILTEGKADLFAQPVISKLSAALAVEGCELLCAQERDESLESYFINLVGGGSHD